MNSRVSWSVDGIDPSVRERAEAAARRAGMSLSDWLNSNIGDAPPEFRSGQFNTSFVESQPELTNYSIKRKPEELALAIAAAIAAHAGL